MQTTLGQLIVNDSLPPELQDHARSLSGGALDNFLSLVAKDHPEKYKDISHKLMQAGANTSYYEGTTLRLEDLESPIENRQEIFDGVTKAERIIRKSKMSAKDKQEALTTLYGDTQKLIQDETYKQGLAKGNMFARQVQSKARGNPAQLAATISTPSVFQDSKGKTVPIFVRRSYAEGLSPAEYYAASFGTRKSVISTKFATREAGDLGKQLNVASAGTIVTMDDCGTTNGLPVSSADMENVGSVLARNSAGFGRGIPVDTKMMRAFSKKKVGDILVRSPVTCGASKGICAKCAGLNEEGKFPALRDHVGIKASSALAERIAQGSLNVKHSGGQRGKETTYAGFPIVNQIAQIPKVFRHRASVAESEGTVERIEEAPQGGMNIYINGQAHYVDAEQAPEVKVGDEVEAGDQLSTGIVNPAEVVKHKGIGAGRKYFAERLTKAFKDSKLPAHRRNVEIATKAIIDHVDIDDPTGLGNYLPGDTVSYTELEHSYKPRKNSVMTTPQQAVGKYLEQPVLHHTIGTKLTKKSIAQLREFGVDNVLVNDNEPGFTPRMIRLRAVPQQGKDWMAKLQGSYLGTNLLKDVHSASTSQVHSNNPIPGLAYGAEFGESKKNEVTY